MILLFKWVTSPLLQDTGLWPDVWNDRDCSSDLLLPDMDHDVPPTKNAQELPDINKFKLFVITKYNCNSIRFLNVYVKLSVSKLKLHLICE